MTGFYGGDTEQMIDCYNLFEGRSDLMQGTLNSIQLALERIEGQWVGDDFETFKATFWDDIRPRGKEILDRIEEMGRELREHAQEQDDASDAEAGIVETLKDIYSNLSAGWGVITDTAKALWKGIKNGEIDWGALRKGAGDLEDWWKSSGIGGDIKKLLDNKGLRRIGKFIPFVDIPLGIYDVITADNPTDRALAVASLIGAAPFLPTQILGLAADTVGVADWIAEEFFDYDLSREVHDFFRDLVNDAGDRNTWGTGLYPWIG